MTNSRNQAPCFLFRPFPEVHVNNGGNTNLLIEASMLKYLTVAFVLLIPVAVKAQTQQHPNVVVILADDMGYGDVSCNNPASRIQTPNLDRLAKEGMRFTDAHSGGSSCIPSRYALMTGRFAVRASMSLSNGPLIEQERMTVASLLREHGYSTAMVGKWHLGFDPFLQNARVPADYSKPLRGGPVDRGFDSFFGMHASLDLPPYFYIRDRRPVMAPTDDVAANSSVGGPEGWNNIQGAFWREGKIAPDVHLDQVTPRFFDEAVSIIQKHTVDHKDKPLFLYLALPSPHTPWLPLEEFRGRSGAGMYGDFVLQVDSGIGRVLTSLKSAGIDQDTLVVFSSDNGPVWYEKDIEKFGHDAVDGLRGMKFSSWEGGHRMPFLVRWPRRMTQHGVCEQTVVFSDVFATLAELVEANSLPAGTAEDSVSFLPWLLDANRPPAKRNPVIHDRSTIRDGDWKLILPAQGKKAKANATAELYNLKSDLAEHANLISEHPEIAERLKQQLLSFQNGNEKQADLQ
jgi:arylsulfatase A